MTDKEFWYWYYWLEIKQVTKLKECTEVLQFKKLGVRRIYLN